MRMCHCHCKNQQGHRPNSDKQIINGLSNSKMSPINTIVAEKHLLKAWVSLVSSRVDFTCYIRSEVCVLISVK